MVVPTFYQQHARAVQARCAGTPIYPSVVLAQLGLESGMGRSELAVLYHNFGGHKASSKWTGPTVRYKTPNDAQKVSTFRVYASFDACLSAHVTLLQNPLYRAAQQAHSGPAQAVALAHIYAEDKQYATKLLNVMRQYQLTQFDGPGAGAGLMALLGAASAGYAAYRYRDTLSKFIENLIS